MMYEELVKQLRTAKTVSITWKGLMADAAAAIEELQAEVKRLELDNEDYEYTLRERYNEPITLEQAIDRLHELGWLQEHDRILSQPHWVSVAQPPKDKQECFVAYKGPLGFVYDTGRFYDDLNSGLDEDIFVEGTSGFVFGGEVGYALESMDYWMPIEPPKEE